jgi:hypothetical protein
VDSRADSYLAGHSAGVSEVSVLSVGGVYLHQHSLHTNQHCYEMIPCSILILQAAGEQRRESHLFSCEHDEHQPRPMDAHQHIGASNKFQLILELHLGSVYDLQITTRMHQ